MQQERWFSLLDRATTIIEVDVEIDFPRDRKDAKFISCALAGRANFLITGDRDFTEAQTLMDTKIISVFLLKSLVCDTQE